MTELNWPPTEKQIKALASAALNQSKKKDVRVLIYWENDPNLMIFEPDFFANTEYIQKNYTCNDRRIEVIIGNID